MARKQRSAEEKAQTRAQLLEGAARALVTQGVHRATLGDIAKACDCTPPTLYAYFENKDAILEAIVQTVAMESAELLKLTVPAGLTLPQRLELVLEPTLRWGERRALMIRVASTAVASGATHSDWVGKDPMPHYVGQLAALMRDEESRRWIGDVPPEEAAYVLWGLIHGQGLYLLQQEQRSETVKEQTRRIVRRFLAAVAADGGDDKTFNDE